MIGKRSASLSCGMVKRMEKTLDELKEWWLVEVTISGMGDIHDPEIKPFIIINGTRWEKITSWETADKSMDKDGDRYGLKNIKFSAFIGKKIKVFYNNKTTGTKHKKEIDTLIENWTEFADTREASSLRPDLEEITKCNFCGMKKVPGRRMHGYSQSHSICVFCMMKSVASWLAIEREKL